jgi:hypothetical protein
VCVLEVCGPGTKESYNYLDMCALTTIRVVVVSFQTINLCRNKLYLLCKLTSINLEITRESGRSAPPFC